MKYLFIICFIMSLGNCYDEKNLIEQAKAQVKYKLKDADSAKFRNIYVKDKSLVCGEVNAKNSYGGYSGFVFFNSVIRGDNGKLDTTIQSYDGKYNIGGVLCKQITMEELTKK